MDGDWFSMPVPVSVGQFTGLGGVKSYHLTDRKTDRAHRQISLTGDVDSVQNDIESRVNLCMTA